MKVDELEHVLRTARAAAHEAGALVLAGFRKSPVVEHKGAVDLVTSFDRDSEDLLRARLSEQLAFDIIGEERGGAPSTGAPTFFIDPIDGTTNFVHGHPFWCVSIGLVVDAAPTLGIVVAPSLGLEWFGYIAEDGTRRAARSTFAGPGAPEEVSCSVSPMVKFEDSLLATGFPYDRRTSDDNNFDAFVAIKRKCQAVRRCGSAALDLCLVADGTYEGYWERKLRPWDLAGGAALVRAAGGRVSDFEGGMGCVASGHVIATNGHIHDALIAELARVTPSGHPLGPLEF